MNYVLREQNEGKIRSFTDLRAWRESHKLAIMIYKATKSFPREEIFSLTSQIRRAALSITSNIAEGFSRRTFPDKKQFYFIALGSLTELQSQLLLAKDLEYLPNGEFQTLADQSVIVSKILNGLIKSTISRNS